MKREVIESHYRFSDVTANDVLRKYNIPESKYYAVLSAQIKKIQRNRSRLSLYHAEEKPIPQIIRVVKPNPEKIAQQIQNTQEVITNTLVYDHPRQMAKEKAIINNIYRYMMAYPDWQKRLAAQFKVNYVLTMLTDIFLGYQESGNINNSLSNRIQELLLKKSIRIGKDTVIKALEEFFTEELESSILNGHLVSAEKRLADSNAL